MRVAVAADLFRTEPMALRVVLISGNEQVGQTGMAIGGDLDRTSGILHVNPGDEANVGMMLTRGDCTSVRVVAQVDMRFEYDEETEGKYPFLGVPI